MLPKKYRLERKDTQKTIKHGKKVMLHELRLVWETSKDQQTKIALVVYTSVDKKAVVRNRIKRLFKKAVYDFLHEIKPGKNIVFFIRRNSGWENPNSLKKDIHCLCKKASLLV